MKEPARYPVYEIPGRFLSLLAIESPANLVRAALQAIHNVARHAKDFIHIGIFLGAQAYDYPGFEVAMEQQEGQALFALVGEHIAYDLP